MTAGLPQWAQEKTEASSAINDDERLVLSFLGALSSGKAEELRQYLCPDCMYQNMPLPPAYGEEAVVRTLEGLFVALSVDRIETLFLASRDGFVFTERIDYLTAKHNGLTFDLPVSGTLQVSHGRIKAWRDYFDLREFEEAVGLQLRPGPIR